MQGDLIKHHICHVCRSPKVAEISGYSTLNRVTSDCRPWPAGGRLGVCEHCGTVQKVIDADFKADVHRIYESYSVYHQAAGEEQRVFDQARGESARRSEVILRRAFMGVSLPRGGRLLDIGCGNGNLLRSFSAIYPGWTLAGSELDERNREMVERIKNVEAFYTGGLGKIPGRFDLVAMFHSLEHMVDPAGFLDEVRDKLVESGRLLIQVPDYTRNPFDLVIADHCMHFDPASLERLVYNAGYENIEELEHIIPKEITLLVDKTESMSVGAKWKISKQKYQVIMRNITSALNWLREVVAAAKLVAKGGEFGIFGTSIAGAWLYSEMGDAVSFFVDEDPSRAGGEFMGRPVYRPADVPSGWNVFIALTPPVAAGVRRRMEGYRACFHLPPAMKNKVGLV